MNDLNNKFTRRIGIFLRKYAFLFPFMIIEAIVIITMSASLCTLDAAFLSLSLASAAAYAASVLFSSKVHTLSSLIFAGVSAAALAFDVLLSSRAFTIADYAVLGGVCVFAIYAVTKSGRRKLLSKRGCTAAAALAVLGTAAIYAAVGEHFAVQDPYLVLMCHVCAVLALALAYFKPKCRMMIKLGFAFAAPIAAFLLLEFLTHNPFADIKAAIFLLNAALFILLAWTLIFIFGRSAPALIITVIFPLIFGLVSYFTVEFRGTPLFPWDLASYGIAATVLGGYNLTVTPTVALVCSAAVLACVSAAVFGFRLRVKKSRAVRPVAAVLLACALIGGTSYLQTDRAIDDFDLYPYLFLPHHLYKMNGFAVSFLMNLRYTTVEKPDGYSDDAASEIASGYISDSLPKDTVKPNIIVVMNESFADMKALCDFETSEEYMPFINSLEENTAKGELHVSIVGGNTPNSEFEFLTGMTMGYLPAGSIPYQQFIKSARPSLVSQLDSLGYRTVAMHPYWAEGCKRETVYPLLGFEEMHFLNYDTYGSFNNYPLIREYISDEGVYDKIRLTYEETAGGEPLFIFAVTMQNHSGYSHNYENFNPEIVVDGLEDNFELSTYMSLIRESDAAFAGLIEYFKDVDEPTIILMFGDHQPNASIASPLLSQAGTVYDDSDIEGSESRYKVPYVLWSNYGLLADIPEVMSLNYLSAVLTDAAELPLTGAQKFSLVLMEDFPVITGRCIINSDGKISPVSDYVLYDKPTDYSYLQYCYLFDGGNIPNGFWTLNE